MKKILHFALFSFTALLITSCASQPVEKVAVQPKPYRSIASVYKNVGNCLKGFNPAQQEKNLALCQEQLKPGQVCETNLFVHGQSAYDVCTRAPETAATRIISCAKGFNQAEQNANASKCRAHLASGQVCETNWNVHGQAIYDVCMME